MKFQLGKDAKFYLGDELLSDTVTPATATWTEQSNVRDLTNNFETGEADITTRGNNGWRATAATLKDGSVEFEMIWDSEDTGFTAILNAWMNSTQIAAMSLDGPKDEVGRQGVASNFTVTNFTRSEPLEEAITVSVTLKPSSFTQWYKKEAA